METTKQNLTFVNKNKTLIENMKIFTIEPLQHKPAVLMDPQKNIFNFSGYSLPEDAIDFYQPILNWILQYETICEEKIKSPCTLQVTFKIIYFNSASNRAFLEIFRLLKRISLKGLNVNIDWYYEQDDKNMFESGKDLSEIAGLNINFCNYTS